MYEIWFHSPDSQMYGHSFWASHDYVLLLQTGIKLHFPTKNPSKLKRSNISKILSSGRCRFRPIRLLRRCWGPFHCTSPVSVHSRAFCWNARSHALNSHRRLWEFSAWLRAFQQNAREWTETGEVQWKGPQHRRSNLIGRNRQRPLDKILEMFERFNFDGFFVGKCNFIPVCKRRT